MATENDVKILALKEEIEKKKKQLTSGIKFSPVTNCSIALDGVRHNLHVETKDGLLLLIAKLNGLKKSLAEVMPSEQLVIEGYSVDDWLTDLVAKFNVLNISKERERLQKLESKLHNLLSVDKKVELEIEDLKDQI